MIRLAQKSLLALALPLSLSLAACGGSKKEETMPPDTAVTEPTDTSATGGEAGAEAGAGVEAGAGAEAGAGVPTPAPAEPAKPAVSDAQIAAIVVAANEVDIKAGELALKKTKNKEVKAFAQMMIQDHKGVNKGAVELVTKLGVTPEENDVSKSLRSGGDETMKKLEGMKGAEFDKAYIDNEVAYHEAVIKALDELLIPSAQNAELKNMLTSVRPAFVAHLEHARGIQAKLGGGTK